jgi:hypothetical protein
MYVFVHVSFSSRPMSHPTFAKGAYSGIAIKFVESLTIQSSIAIAISDNVLDKSVAVPADYPTNTTCAIHMYIYVIFLQPETRHSKGALHIFPQPQIHIDVATATNTSYTSMAASREAMTPPCPRTPSFFALDIAVPGRRVRSR